MDESLLTVLIFTPVILAAVATAIAWRHIAHRALYAVVALFVLLGLQATAAPAAVGYFLPGGSDLTAASANRAYVQTVIAGAIAQVVLGTLILWWLARALRKP